MTKNISRKQTLNLSAIGDVVRSGTRPLFAILLALIASAGLIIIAGANPLIAYGAMLKGAVGSMQSISNTLVRVSPLLLGGLGAAIGIKAGLWNVGIEGQMYAGAMGATAIGLVELPVPSWLHILLAILAAAICGALWGMIPAYLRAYRGVNEVVTTIMMNYIGIFFASWMVHEPQPLAQPDAFFPMSRIIVPGARFPILIKGTSLHPGAFIGIILCILMYLMFRYTSFGFRTRMLGANPEASRYAGMKVRRQILLVFLLSSALGGMAGAGEILGLKLRLYDFFVGGVGYEALAAALLVGGSPIGVIFSTIFFAGLKVGATTMQIVTGIEAPMALVIQALCVLFVIGVGFTEKKRAQQGQEEESESVEEAKANGA